MIRLCAWCGYDMGNSEPVKDLRVTHGVCEVCFDRVGKEPGWLGIKKETLNLIAKRLIKERAKGE